MPANKAAYAGVPDIGIYCEPALAHAIRTTAEPFTGARGIPVSLLTAPAGLILAQVKQNPAHDLLILPAASMDQAAARDFIDPRSRKDFCRNPIVLACRAGAPLSAGNPPELTRLLAEGRVAATDATPADTLDGVGLLQRLGLAATLAGRVTGVPNTADAAFLVTTGAARWALVYLSDVGADPGLAVAARLDPAIAVPVTIAAAINSHPKNPNGQAFLDYLSSTDAAGPLRRSGLELTA